MIYMTQDSYLILYFYFLTSFFMHTIFVLTSQYLITIFSCYSFSLHNVKKGCRTFQDSIFARNRLCPISYVVLYALDTKWQIDACTIFYLQLFKVIYWDSDHFTWLDSTSTSLFYFIPLHPTFIFCNKTRLQHVPILKCLQYHTLNNS